MSAYPPPRPPSGPPGRGFGGPGGPGGSGGHGGHGGPPPRRGRPGRAVRVDPVLVELGVGLVWLAVGTLGLGADGAGTLLLAVGIAVAIGIGVENRRRGPRPFDTTRSTEVLRLAGGVIGLVVLASIALGLLSGSAFLPGLALVLTGAAFALLSRATGQRPTRWLGFAFVGLGLLSALLSTMLAGGFVTQGLLGILAGLLVLVSAADRVGLVEMLRDRTR
ncbi:hypothetical protein [Actinomycetospora cinnamomea]|uniref:hypothetical protein n=1 Tax=Actinomycetospora cinnamomea TaxID=663609 RepID=UPI001057621A|nr:hypothetical protein [Actinomycetospora cinnamomea]